MPDPDRSETTAREDWMAILAKAPADHLAEAFNALGPAPEFEWLRAPETGAVMVRGRTGATGAPFNLGEMTVTRCTLRLADGAVGHAYAPGRDKEKARVAALCDALLQGDRAGEVRAYVLTPLADHMQAERERRAGKAETSKVDFFTMVRGEG
jgi:alpha-D-ribose 1-methylphosphonate 5-triphosphate synthase subunit PhnG